MPYKILTVDDHQPTLDIVMLTLQQHGFEVIGSSSPVEALSIAEKSLPNLILLDMNMPILSGLEVCRRIRAHGQLANTPVIMFSAEAAEKIKCFEAGADDFIVKPTAPDELVSRIEALLEGVDEPEGEDESAQEIGGSFYIQPAEMIGGDAKLDEEARRSDQCRQIIAVLGARGGCGSTTTAINLAVTASKQGCLTTLMDLDLVQGHIGMYLKAKKSGAINAIADLPVNNIHTQLTELMMPYMENLRLMLTNPNLCGQFRMPTAEQIASTLELVQMANSFTVVDLGRQSTEVTNEVIGLARKVVICIQPERIAISSCKELLRDLRRFPHLQSAVHVVLLGSPDQMNLPTSAIEQFIGQRLAAVIPYKQVEMVQAVNRGAPYVRQFPHSEIADVYRDLTNILVTV